jgi:mannose-6-phosphate isomerase-like protein (cupin superfamily)
MAVRIFHRDHPDQWMPMIASDARLVVWPGVGAMKANMNYVHMQPGEQNVPHVHKGCEDTIFVLEGRGTIADLSNDRELEFEAGQVVHVAPDVHHQVDRAGAADGGAVRAGSQPRQQRRGGGAHVRRRGRHRRAPRADRPRVRGRP